jgi:hypothetical protein
VSATGTSVLRMDDSAPTVRLRAWTAADLSLLEQANTPEMRDHLGDPEPGEQLLDRHRRYLQLKNPQTAQMFAVLLPDAQPVGIIGYWERAWQRRQVYWLARSARIPVAGHRNSRRPGGRRARPGPAPA